MRSPNLFTALTLAVGLSLAACGSTESEPGPAAPSPTDSAEDVADPTATVDPPVETLPDDSSITSEERPMTPKPDASELPLGPVPDEVVARSTVQDAIAEAAKREGVQPADVSVAGFADVTWSDGSVGCPQAGMQYTMALVPGHQLILQVDDRYLSYHASQDSQFSYCAAPVAPVPGDAVSPDS